MCRLVVSVSPRGRIRSSCVLAVLALASVAFADPPYSVTAIRQENGYKEQLTIEVVQSAHAKADGDTLYLTGTNINLTIASEFVDPVPLPHERKIDWIELKVDGQLIKR